MPGNTEISGRTRTSKRQWQWQLLPHHFTQLIVCLLVIVSSAFNGYSEVTLHELARASSLSYLSLDKIPTSPYYDKCNLEPLTQVVDPISKSGATIFRVINNNNDNKQIIVIACRGTANLSNFGTNLQFKLVEATQLSCDYVPDDARVHEGFQTASLGLWKKLSQPLLGQVVKNAATSVVFTGHSLGGATALLCATHFRASNGDTQQSPDVVTVSFRIIYCYHAFICISYSCIRFLIHLLIPNSFSNH